MAQPLLDIRNLTIGFNTDRGFSIAVADINLTIQPGETLALVGESGGGKSVTALAVMELLPVAARVDDVSEIYLDQQDVLQLAEVEMRKIRGKRIAMIFQEAMTALNPVLTIEQQIDEVLRCHFKLSHQERWQQVLELLTEVGMPNPEHYAKCYPHQLSGGQRQRAMIAMALAGKPDLLIADEPTTALDVTLQAQILKLLKELQQKNNMSMLFITHDLAVVSQMADYVAVIQHGVIVEQAPKEQFFRQPKHPYSLQLFAALPNWQQVKSESKPNAHDVPLLNVKDLKVYFPIRKGIMKRVVDQIKAVDGISLSIYPGKTLALVGESGSGKTTAAKGILRLSPVYSGQVIFNGVDLATVNDEGLRGMRRDLQFIFQDPFSAMNPRMLVMDILEEGLLAQGMYRTEQERLNKIDQVLQLVGLDVASKYRYPHEFSGGQRQRICIARSLVLNPKLLICDEPTSSLDVSSQLQVLQLLQHLQVTFGLSYLLITHNLAVVAYLADEIAVMHQGKIVEFGTTKNILNQPQHPYTKELLSAIPTLAPFKQGKKTKIQ